MEFFPLKSCTLFLFIFNQNNPHTDWPMTDDRSNIHYGPTLEETVGNETDGQGGGGGGVVFVGPLHVQLTLTQFSLKEVSGSHQSEQLEHMTQQSQLAASE